ncbi:RNA-directed DNA polymerase from mobile element jockey, partial [Paramuricea clavata]
RWLEIFDDFLDKIYSNNNFDGIYITGDDSSSHLFKSLVDDYFLTQVNNQPTRGNNILDLLFADSPEKISNLLVGDPLIYTDHLFMEFTMRTTIRSIVKKPRSVYNYRKGNFSTLREYVKSLTSDVQLNEIVDINNVWYNWKSSLQSMIDQYIPKIQLKSKSSPPWISGEIIHLVRKKASARIKAKSTQLSIHWERFKELRSRIKKLISRKRKEYYTSLVESLYSNPKRFWTTFSQKTKKHTVPEKVSIADGAGGRKFTEGPNLVADTFNRFFFSSYSTPEVGNPQVHSNDQHYHPSSPIPSLSQISLDSVDVLAAIKTIDSSKAQGPDKIPAKILVECAEQISPSLTDLFNLSLQSGTLPTEWKLANIVPLLKKAPAEKVENYRAISLLSLVSKLLKRCILNKIIDHIASNLSNLQFGFLKGRSTTSQLLSVYHKIQEAMDAGIQTDMVFLDFSKAFDFVNHHKLIFKLKLFGITGKLHEWLKDYLSNRSQQTTVLGATSMPLPVLSGVPQGSVLGPILFLIYINDIVEVVHRDSGMALYSDDSKCFKVIKSLNDSLLLQSDLDNLSSWSKSWNMDFNETKCAIVSFTRKHHPIIQSYSLNGSELRKVNEQKDLGILTTSSMEWSSHVATVCSKANRTLGYIRRCSAEIGSLNARRTLYTSLVRSLFSYRSQLWAPQKIKYINMMERVQRRATKFLLKLPFRTKVSYQKRLLKLGLLPLTYWLEILDLVFYFRTLKGEIFLDNNGLVQIKQQIRISRHNNPQSGVLVEIPRAKTISFQNSFSVRTRNMEQFNTS